MHTQNLGKKGEDIACTYLQKKGHKILFRNYRSKKTEIDVVSEFENQLIVVEVKTRNDNSVSEPWSSVTYSKQKAIIRTANSYIHRYNIHLSTRFDIISIVHNNSETKIEHIEDAFSP